MTCAHIFTLCLSDGDRVCNRCGIRRRYPTDNPDQIRRRNEREEVEK
jgi:hypothetical protein